ncbi:MAG: TIGR03032 family protein [Pseudomonadota bacterium]
MSDLATAPESAIFSLDTSRQFVSWLAEQQVSLAFTTYQAGKLYLIGHKPDATVSVHERSFERCMGVTAHGSSLYLGGLYQLYRFNNVLERGQQARDGVDCLYVPQQSWITGDIDLHDLAIDADGRPVFVNTLFSCLATVSPGHSFAPLWSPPWISKLAAEDRCHLNGLAMRDGQPAYVTAVSETDVHEGWREHRRDGGVVVSVADSEVVCRGLSMPHSPRWHQGKLWLLNSGEGDFGHVDLTTGRFVPLTFMPGYARGLTFVGDFAIIGLSKPRKVKTFDGLALQERLDAKQISARCGLIVVDLRSGDIVHSLTLEGVVQELYDVVTLPGVRTPSALGFKTDEIRRVLSLGPAQALSAAALPAGTVLNGAA